MRPRVFPAEDAGDPERHDVWFGFASMRPRVFPAEDSRLNGAWSCCRSCFNEAAGIPRGGRIGRLLVARNGSGFNEAAGIPRGGLEYRNRFQREIEGLQ